MVSNPFSAAKEAGISRLASQFTPSEIPHVQLAADVAVGMEHQQSQALNRALAAVEADGSLYLTHKKERRKKLLLSAVDAISDQQFRAWWFETIGAAHMDNATDAAQYAGIEGREWADALRDWYADAHERGLVDTPPAEADARDRAEVAANVTESRYGLGLAEFVEGVVNWDRGQATRNVFAGPLDRHTHLIDRLAEEIEARNERIAELEAEVAEGE